MNEGVSTWNRPELFFEEGELETCEACGQRLKAPCRCNVLACPNCKHNVRAAVAKAVPLEPMCWATHLEKLSAVDVWSSVAVSGPLPVPEQ